MFGVTGSSPAPTSACDLLSILSTSALPKGVYGSGLNTGVPGVSCVCASHRWSAPPPPPVAGGEYSDELAMSRLKLTGEPDALSGEPGAPSGDPSCPPARRHSSECSLADLNSVCSSE